jgi:hypothetical protein
MVAVDAILREIDQRVPQAVSLTVGRMLEDRLDVRRLLMEAAAAEAFREQCRLTRDRIASRTPTSYATNAELDEGEIFVIDDNDTLGEIAAFRQLAENLGNIPTTAPAELDTTVKLYAVAVGDDERVLFVRKTDPRLSHKAGRFLAIGAERLSRVEEPAFTFSSDFDFVLGSSWAVVLNQKSFEMLFRDIGLVQKHIDTWISGITDHLPMRATSIAQLREVAQRDSRTWRKLRDIKQRGHLAGVQLGEVRRYAKVVGLDPDKVVVNDELVFDPAERFSFLHLLNEDLYKGPLTEEVFEAQRKASID